jgi:hypothetical protein
MYTEFLGNQHMNLAIFTALGSGRLYQPEETADTHICYRLIRPPRLWCNRKELFIRNPIGRISNRTRDLPACGTVSQPNQSYLGGNLDLSIETRQIM